MRAARRHGSGGGGDRFGLGYADNARQRPVRASEGHRFGELRDSQANEGQADQGAGGRQVHRERREGRLVARMWVFYLVGLTYKVPMFIIFFIQFS